MKDRLSRPVEGRAAQRQLPTRAVPSVFSAPVRVGAVLVAIALIFLIPGQLSDAGLATLSLAGVYAIVAIGLTLFTGRMGQLTLAAPAFMGVGAYGTALMGAQSGWPFTITLLVALAAGLILGLLAGLIAIRLSGDVLAITTLGILALGEYVWDSWTPVTGGDEGTSAAATPTVVFGLDIAAIPGMSREQSLFIATWIVVALVAYFATSILGFRPGRAMQAIHDSQRTAEAIGVNVRAYKIRVSAIMGACAALAGVLYAVNQQYIAPTGFGADAALLMFAIILLGGNGRVSGAIIGAILLWSFKIWISTGAGGTLDFLIKQSQSSPGLITPGALSALVYGLLIVLVLMYAPDGLTGVWDRVVARFSGARKTRIQPPTIKGD